MRLYLRVLALALVAGCKNGEICPTSCDDNDACTQDRASGSAQTCTLSCEHEPIVACASGDGCCPGGCTHTTDLDCPFYVDATLGDDSNDGLTPETAWKTAGKVASQPLSPSDRVAFKRGETWRETLLIKSSGSDTAPITFTSYGTASDPPTFSPAQRVTGWTKGQNEVWIADFETEAVQVFVDGKRMTLAHHPNQGYLYVDQTEDAANKTSFLDNDLTLTRDQVLGATIFLRGERWDLETSHVADLAGQRVTVSTPFVARQIDKNDGYILANMYWMLDSPGEWFWDAAAKKLHIRLPDDSDPSGHQIEVSSAGDGIDVTSRNVVLDGLRSRYAGGSGIYLKQGLGIQVHGCRIEGAGNVGLNVWLPAGDGAVIIEDSTILGTALSGIYVTSDIQAKQQLVLRRNLVEDTMVEFPGLGGDAGATYLFRWGSALGFSGTKGHVHDNIFRNAGYSCSIVGGSEQLIEHNLFERCCTRLDDGGGVYMGGWGHVVRENFVLDSLGNSEGTAAFFTDQRTSAEGIYADDRSHDITIERNTVVNADLDIQIHNSQGDIVRDNVLFAARRAGIHLSADTIVNDPSFMHGNVVEGNVFLSPAGAPSMVETGGLGSTAFGSFENNVYWSPQNQKPIVRSVVTDGNWTSAQFSLDEWRAETGYDLRSVDLTSTYQVFPTAGVPTGQNLLQNGSFDANISTWQAWAPDGGSVSWASSCGLTGGCLSFVGNNTGQGALTYGNSVQITAGQGYVIRFSARAGSPQQVSAVLRRAASPWESLGLTNTISVRSVRSDFTFPFVATGTATGRLDFSPSAESFAFFLDDVSVREATIFQNDPADDARILQNPSGSEVEIDLGAERYCDLENGVVGGKVELAPWTSQVLVACQCNNDHVCGNRETAASCPQDCP